MPKGKKRKPARKDATQPKDEWGFLFELTEDKKHTKVSLVVGGAKHVVTNKFTAGECLELGSNFFEAGAQIDPEAALVKVEEMKKAKKWPFSLIPEGEKIH